MAWWNKEEEESAERLPAVVGEKSDNAPVQSGRAASPSTANAVSSGADLEKKYGTIRSALSEGTVIQGKLSFDTPVRIDGNLMGEVFSSSVLIVGPSGSVAADINVETLVVMGSVSGEIRARKRLELHSNGEVIGNIETPSLFVADGAYFEGACAMDASASKEKAPEKAKEEKNTIEKAATKVPIVTSKGEGKASTVISAKGSAMGKDSKATDSSSKSSASKSSTSAVH